MNASLTAIIDVEGFDYVPVGVVKLLHQSSSISQSDLYVGDGLRLVQVDRRTGLSLTRSLISLIHSRDRHQFWSGTKSCM